MRRITYLLISVEEYPYNFRVFKKYSLPHIAYLREEWQKPKTLIFGNSSLKIYNGCIETFHNYYLRFNLVLKLNV